MKVASDGIGVLTLNRPDAGNALSVGLVAELGEAIRRVRFDDAVRVLVITGAGRMFCAGVDLKERDRPATWLSDARAALDAVEALEIPVIAAINGTCLGGGLELALAADIRIGAQSARLGLPEIVFGAPPAFGGAARLTRLVGPGRAKHLMLTGETVTAAEALGYGLVEEAVPDGTALDRAMQLARAIAVHARYAVRTGKQVIDRGRSLPGTAATDAEYAVIDAMATEDERAQAARAAMERSPTYSKLLG